MTGRSQQKEREGLFSPTKTKRILFFILSDAILSLASFRFAYELRFNFETPAAILSNFPAFFAILLGLKLLFMAVFGVFASPWRFFSIRDALKLLKSHIFTYLAFFAVVLIAISHNYIFPRSVVVIDLFLSLFLLSTLRAAKRVYLEASVVRENFTLIVGANEAGESIARYLFAGGGGLYPMAFADSDKQKIGSTIHGIKVYDESRLKDVIQKLDITCAIIAKELGSKELAALFDKLEDSGVKTVKKASFFSEEKRSLSDISIEDFLARQPKDLDKNAIAAFLNDKVVMITGAGGSIGSEIARQCAMYKAKKLILIDNGEYNLYKISDELEGFDIHSLLISVTDKQKLEVAFKMHRPEIVIHAAAYKHVPLVEDNIEAAVINNIIGTKNCVDLSVKYKAKKFVLVSTDKAVRPTNVMGATKRICELYAQNAHSDDTEIVAVRFGNVIGSSGSVIPKFKEQIESGGAVTVTHPEIERYFMLISEACELVLQAAAIAEGGEIFILDMGERVKIVDLAKKMIRLAGKEGEVKIEFVGLRPGEKLYEELLTDEAAANTKYESIMIAKATPFDIEQLLVNIEKLVAANDKIAVLKEIVPEFEHSPNTH